MAKSAWIGFSLTTSAAWGSSNFLGGYASRGASSLVLSTISHLSALMCLVIATRAFHVPLPSLHALIWGILAGTVGGLALAILYGSLSTGRMGLASPIVGLLSVGIPAMVTIVREGSPGELRLTGFALAILGIALIGRTKDKTEKKTIGMAILAGCGFAAYSLAIKQAGNGSPFWIDSGSRLAALFVTATITFFAGKARDLHPRAVAWALSPGCWT